MKRFAVYIYVILIFLMSISASYGQLNNDPVDVQIWSDITLTYFKTQKFSFGGDVGLRSSIHNQDWSLFYLRPTLHYHFTPIFKLSGGLGAFNTLNKSFGNTYEVRLFQDAQISWPDIGWLDFFHRLRFEQRFFFYSNTENDVFIRGRYLFRARTMNFKLIGKKRGYYIKAMWEAFVPIGDGAAEKFVNNQRWYAALGYQPSDRYRFELFYIWQKSRNLYEDGFHTSENIFRFRIFYTLKLPE